MNPEEKKANKFYVMHHPKNLQNNDKPSQSYIFDHTKSLPNKEHKFSQSYILIHVEIIPGSCCGFDRVNCHTIAQSSKKSEVEDIMKWLISEGFLQEELKIFPVSN